MEKEIEILEEVLKDKEWYKKHGGEDIGFKEVQAIENLIKGYRKLQDRFIKYEKTLENLQKETIWKSKIKEKIEEADKKILEYEAYREKGKETDVEYYDFIANSVIKKVLLELMEDK